MIQKIIAFLLFCHLSVADTVTIGIEEWYPVIGNPKSSSPGYMLEIANHTFEEIRYRVIPWRRALEEVRNNRLDCVLGAGQGDLVALAIPSESWGKAQFNVYVRSHDKWAYQGLDSLRGRHVGVVKGYSYDSKLDSMIKKTPEVFSPLTGVLSLDKNIKRLMAGRIDTFIDEGIVTQYKLHQMGLLEKVKKVGYVTQSEPMYIACSPEQDKVKNLTKKVDESIIQLRSSGRLEQIMNKYGLRDWQ